jgi:hypothetical protein
MNKDGIIYLACPYTHKDSKIMESRFNKVNKMTADLMKEGYTIFSPISHCHPIAINHNVPSDWKFWKKYDTEFIKNSKGMFVYMLDGWKESVGVQSEIEIATELNIPIEYIQEQIELF